MTILFPSATCSTQPCADDLAGRYLRVLADFDVSLLDRHASAAGAKLLSGLFLPSVPPGLASANKRIMIVGCETRKWGVLKQGECFTTLPDYVARAMQIHQQYFAQQLTERDGKGRSFHNFTRSIAKRCGSEGLIYANLLCMSWNEGSPRRSEHFNVIKKYSQLLLKEQIAFFAPDIVIFANGSASAGYRRAFFPLERDIDGKAIGEDFEGIANQQLWKFNLGAIACYRIQHPSARTQAAADARKFLLDLLSAQ